MKRDSVIETLFSGGCTLWIILLCLWVPAWAEPSGQHIILHRPVSVGERQRWTVRGSSREETADLKGGVVSEKKSHERTYHLEGNLTVKEVDTAGQIRLAELQISIFTQQDQVQGPKTVLAEPNSILSATRKDGKMVVQLNGQNAPEQVRAACRLLLQLPFSEITLDDVWGPKTPVAAGNSWNANPVLLADQFSSLGIHADPKDVYGWMKFEALKEKKGATHQHLRWELDMKASSDAGVPELAEQIQATVTEQGLMILPSHPQSTAKEEQIEMVFESRIPTGDPDHFLLLNIETKIQKTIKPLSP